MSRSALSAPRRHDNRRRAHRTFVWFARQAGWVLGPVPGWFVLLIDPVARRCTGIAQVSDRGVRFDLDLSEFVQRKFYCRSYERRELRFIRRWLRPGDTFVDVGANVGLLALTAAQRVRDTGHVVAIEPIPQNAERLASNCALNPDVNVEIRRVAIGSESATITIGLDDRQHSQNNRGSYSRSSTSNLQEVAVRRLDEILTLDPTSAKRFRLLKIDVEGMERQVLEGAAELLGSRRFDAIMLEDNPSLGGYDTSLTSILELAGYDMHRIGPFARLCGCQSSPTRLPRLMRRLGSSRSVVLRWIGGSARLTTLVAVRPSE